MLLALQTAFAALALALDPTEANIAYDQFAQTKLDVFVPAGAAGKKLPGVLAIHGGGWRSGSKESYAPNLVEPWVAKGFVVVSVEYRLSGVAPAPAAAQDALKAAEWFRKNAAKYNVDPKRIIVTGTSAGAHLALLVGLLTKGAGFGPTGRVAAIVNLWGITDVNEQIEGPGQRDYAVQWLPESMANRRELALQLSPQRYVRKGLPPVLTVHSDADQTVPYEHGVTLTKMLRAEGNDAELYCLKGAAHGFPKDRVQEVYSQIFPFLAKRGLMP